MSINKSIIYLAIVTVAGTYASIMLAFYDVGDQSYDNVTNTQGAEKARAVKKAKQAFADLQREGADFSNGPCISENLMYDWSADVAHNPRQAIDDLPENQCRAFREGDTHHFVELDENGGLIKIY